LNWFIDELKTVKDKVKALLEMFPPLKDDDNKLLAYFWFYQVGEENIKVFSAKDLLKKISDGELTNSETIRRVRQKIQEENPKLRGKSYRLRKSQAEEVRQEIKNV
jgi:hypothetical protein